MKVPPQSKVASYAYALMEVMRGLEGILFVFVFPAFLCLLARLETVFWLQPTRSAICLLL